MSLHFLLQYNTKPKPHHRYYESHNHSRMHAHPHPCTPAHIHTPPNTDLHPASIGLIGSRFIDSFVLTASFVVVLLRSYYGYFKT